LVTICATSLPRSKRPSGRWPCSSSGSVDQLARRQHLGEALGEHHRAECLPRRSRVSIRSHDPLGELLERQVALAGLLARARQRVVDVLDAEHEARLAGDRDAVRQPARLAAHRLDDEVAARREASARRFWSSFAITSTAVKKPNVKSMPR
jgi:hypothetical protein